MCTYTCVCIQQHVTFSSEIVADVAFEMQNYDILEKSETYIYKFPIVNITGVKFMMDVRETFIIGTKLLTSLPVVSAVVR